MKQEEHNEQAALFRWAALAAGRYPELALLFAVPNGGRRDAVTGARLKAEGVKAGVPDIWLPVARCGYHGLVIELKAEGGRASREQKAWLRALEEQGWLAAVCVGATAAWELLGRYLEGTYPQKGNSCPKVSSDT
jgi:hypothetical protein